MDMRERKGIFRQEGMANSRCRTAIGSAGSTAAFILGACNVSLIWQLWANVITFLVSVPGLLYTGFNLVTEDAVIDAATTHVDLILLVRKIMFTLLRRPLLVASEMLLLFRMVNGCFFLSPVSAEHEREPWSIPTGQPSSNN